MISVALCTYNGEKYIKEQLESIINQKLPPDEIIICDDVSSDRTKEIVYETLKTWNGNWKFIENKHNLGFIKNFEKAIHSCMGDIIFLSDQDDVWNLDKISIINQVFEEHPETLMVFHDAEIVDSHLSYLGNTVWGLNGLKHDYSKFYQNDYSNLIALNPVQGAAMAFRKELFDMSIPFPDHVSHDDWLALNAALNGEIFPVHQCLLKYRQSGKNTLGASTIGINKIKKWIVNYHKSSEVYRTIFDYQINRWNSLMTKYGEDVVIQPVKCQDILNFWVLRKNIVNRKEFIQLPGIEMYKKLLVNNRQAKKQFIKDRLACF